MSEQDRHSVFRSSIALVFVVGAGVAACTSTTTIPAAPGDGGAPPGTSTSGAVGVTSGGTPAPTAATDAARTPPPTETMTITLSGATPAASDPSYSVSCANYAEQRSGGDAEGPAIDAMYVAEASPACPWPQSKPRLTLAVEFTGFAPSAGPPVGTFDLAGAGESVPYVITVQVASQAEVAVGAGAPYCNYGADEYASNGSFPHEPGISGTMTVTAGPWVDTNTGEVSDAGPIGSGSFGAADGAGREYVVQLTNVKLPGSGCHNGGAFPNGTATVDATIYWAYGAF